MRLRSLVRLVFPTVFVSCLNREQLPNWRCDRDMLLFKAIKNGASNAELREICNNHVLRTPEEFITNCEGGAVYIVAHPDDDLLFQSPDVITDTRDDTHCVTTIYVTSGDAGKGLEYAAQREKGVNFAYSSMLRLADPTLPWTRRIGGSPGLQYPVDFGYWAGHNYQHIFLRLPDGNYHGDGYSNTGYGTLERLYNGVNKSIVTLPNPVDTVGAWTNASTQQASYTLPMLKQTLASIIRSVKPETVRTLDWEGDTRAPVDHSDHWVVGKLVKEVMLGFPSINLVGYIGYATAVWPQNLHPTVLDTNDKADAFFEYAKYDEYECHSYQECVDKGVGEPFWLVRQYHVGDSH